MSDLEKTLIVCACNSVQHQLVVLSWPEDPNWPEIYITLHLAQVPWYKRISYALRYIFGLERNKMGCFEEIMLSPSQAQELVTAINKHLGVKNDHASGNRINQQS
jgi:hypothetical protein